MVDKLQVDAIAVVANPVVFYPHVVALPAVDGVAHEGIEGDVARYVVVRHHAVTAVLNHDAELVGPEHASLHGQPRDSETVYAAVVDARRPPRVAQEQPREGHAVGPDLYDVAFPAAVDYGQAHSPQPHAAPHHQVLAVYGAGMDEDVVAVARGGERAANCRVGLAPPHVELAPSGGEREEQQERQWDVRFFLSIVAIVRDSCRSSL